MNIDSLYVGQSVNLIIICRSVCEHKSFYVGQSVNIDHYM